jgi:hypothetical protein
MPEKGRPYRTRAECACHSRSYEQFIGCRRDDRPFQFDTEFKPLLTTSNIPGYPSGLAAAAGGRRRGN